MTDWVVKLDDFLKISGREILTHAGTVNHEKALRKAHEKYEKYRHAMLEEPTPVERLFLETAKKLERINESPRSKLRGITSVIVFSHRSKLRGI